MRLNLLIICLVCGAFSVTGCTKVSKEELQVKIDRCAAAGMNYTYLLDYKGDPYEVMCVTKRLR